MASFGSQEQVRELGISALKATAFAIAVLLAILGIGSDAHAECSCRDEQTPFEQKVLTAMESANYIALVRIKSTDLHTNTREEDVAVWDPRTQQSHNEKQQFTDHLLVAEFEARRVFKGPDSPTFAVTPAAEDMCGVIFKPGETYLIYAEELEDPFQVSTSQCMRTALEADTRKDIEIIEDIARRKSASFRPADSNPEFTRALRLIHAYAGCGDYRWNDPNFRKGMSEAMAIAITLAESKPLSGQSEVLRAELMSLWQLTDGGKPVELQQSILALTDRALKMDSAFAEAHVARARAYAKGSATMQAMREIQKALAIDPSLESAMLAQADVYRLVGNSSKAEQWARMFTDSTQDPVKQANGYEWLGGMRRAIAYHPQAINRAVDLILAKNWFEVSVLRDPTDPWRMLNLATFLNEYAADFSGAEKYANRALEIQDMAPARHQVAVARYQALQARSAGLDAHSLRAALAEIEATTGLTLDLLVKSKAFHEVVQARLIRLQRSAR